MNRPWPAERCVEVVVTDLVGLTLVIWGWWMASSASAFRDQIAWLNVSVVGLVIAGLANGMWLAGARRLTRPAQFALIAELDRRRSGEAGTTGSSRVTTADDQPVTAPPMTRYHRPGCAFAGGKDTRPASPAEHALAGRQPCEVCQP